MKSAEPDPAAPHVILGNSTAAIGAVEGLRRHDVEAPVVLVSREDRHTYSRPLISYLLAGEVDAAGMHYRPEDFYARHGVEARLGVAASAIDPTARRVRLADGQELPYRDLLIATGGRPFVPELPGVDAGGVFTFTSWDEAGAVAAWVRERGSERAVVIGGGLIGVKAAEALHAMGLGVTVVELADRLLPLALDPTAAELATAATVAAGVELLCGNAVERIRVADGRVAGIELADGGERECGLVIVAVGVRPDTGLAAAAGIACDRGILIDERCRTSVAGIYAAGDVAQATDALTGESRPIPIFPGAYRQGSVAGARMAGAEVRNDAAFAMNAVQVFGLDTISVGQATADGDEVLTRRDPRRPAYRRLVLREGRIVGALCVGDIDRAGIYTGLIRHGVDVGGLRDRLLDDDFGLLSLPAGYRKHVVRGEGIVV